MRTRIALAACSVALIASFASSRSGSSPSASSPSPRTIQSTPVALHLEGTAQWPTGVTSAHGRHGATAPESLVALRALAAQAGLLVPAKGSLSADLLHAPAHRNPATAPAPAPQPAPAPAPQPVPAPAPVPAVAPPDPVSPALRAEWERVALCEEGGNWHADGAVFSGGLGISRTNWVRYCGTQFAPVGALATEDQQIIVAERITGGWVPDQYGCAAW